MQEVYHKKFSTQSHPNIFEIVDAMKKDQACTEMKMKQFELGATQPAQKKRYVDRKGRIRTLFDRFQNGEYSLADHIASVRHQTGL